MDNGADAVHSLVARYFAMWNTGDTADAERILSPGWTDHAHPGISGPGDVCRAVAALRAADPGLRFHIDAALGGHDLVAVVGTVGASRLVWLVRVDNGRLAEMWTYRES